VKTVRHRTTQQQNSKIVNTQVGTAGTGVAGRWYNGILYTISIIFNRAIQYSTYISIQFRTKKTEKLKILPT